MGALSEPLFRRYIIGNALSLLGLWVQRVALGWLTWELTHSGFWLGAIAFADLFPAVLLGPFAGVWADRMDRRTLLLWNQTASALLALLLFALVYSQLITIYLLFSVVLALGVCASISQPARLALIPQLVSADNLSAAVALGSVVFNVARFVGPMIAGAIIAGLDISLAFLFNSLTYLAMAAALLTIPHGLNTVSDDARTSILQQIGDGFRYTLQHPVMRTLIFTITAVAVLGKPIADLLPGFADVVFNEGVIGLAVMTQAMGFGSLTGGLLLARLDNTDALPLLNLIAFGACGALLGLFGMIGSFYLGLALLFFISMAISVTGICTQTLIQHAVREDMRGRVLSIWGMIFRGAPAVGVLALGTLSEFSSLGLVVSVAGCACLLAALYTLPGYAHLKQSLAG